MPLSLYLHIPFCSTRCSYCDFNTYAGIEDRIPAYVDALLAEVRAVAAGLRGAEAPTEVHTIFFGGGTPSLLPSVSLRALMAALRQEFEVAPDVEVTLEANPGTVTARRLESLARLGVNRLSLGGQSASPAELALLGRTHSFADVVQSVRAARDAGFANINVDWILGLPHQTLASWLTTLDRAIELRTEHLSVYSLSLEYGTPMRAWVMRGLVSAPDPDRGADMYEATAERLREAGFVQYEISNWARSRLGARPDLPVEEATFACRHNLQYWRNRPYLGFGAGAHGSALGWRYSNVLSPDGYVRAVARLQASRPPMGPAVATTVPSSPSDSMSETMFLGLRLTGEGVGADGFSRRFGRSMDAVYGAELRRLAGEGLIEWAPDRVRLTARGRLLGNRVFEAFV
ncbi:MAG TPA: radical SAM family heme chaperone HemW [Anaerolineales bacterium]|nr:radical SAM family heme chaperone HemW [Anaerolineales bacterium]